MSRWKASGIQLLLSCVVVGVVLVLMMAVWYPWPLFELAGGARITLILAGVNVALGPLLTLIVFKAGKKGMAFDLTFIAIVQAAALAYGVHVVYVARPVYLTFVVDRFVLVTAKDLDPNDLAQATNPQYRRLPLGRPSYVAAVLPTDLKESTDMLFSGLAGKDVELYPKYYVPYEQQTQNALKRAKDLGILLERDAGPVRGFLDAAGRSPDSVKFLPLRARVDASVLIDAGSGMPLEILKVDPW